MSSPSSSSSTHNKLTRVVPSDESIPGPARRSQQSGKYTRSGGKSCTSSMHAEEQACECPGRSDDGQRASANQKIRGAKDGLADLIECCMHARMRACMWTMPTKVCRCALGEEKLEDDPRVTASSRWPAGRPMRGNGPVRLHTLRSRTSYSNVPVQYRA